jgi:hypothetical protein
MKTLKQYILERAYITDIPFSYELFENFMRDAIIEANYDDSEYWEQMKEAISAVNPKIWRWFYGWCESYLELKNVSIREFYDSIKQIPYDRFERVIGAGSNGIVLTVGDDKVLKVFYGDHIKSIDEPFIKYCHKRKSSVFPYVYKIGKNWCIMEKLKIGTPKCRRYMNTIDNCKTMKFISDVQAEKEPIGLSKDELEVYNWCLAVKREMDAIKSKAIGYPGDLTINNIGERDNGEIIFFDV